MNEEQLNQVKLAINGDKVAFESLMRIHEKSLYAYALSLIGNKYDAEDAVQDTIYRAYKSIKTLKEPMYFKTWLTKILINRCKSIKYRIFSHKATTLNYKTDNFVEFTTDELELWDVVNKLDYNSKIIILLRFVNDLTIVQIASVLNIPENTAKTRLYRSLDKLKKIMEVL